MNRISAVKRLANQIISRLNLTPPIELDLLYQYFDVELIYERNQHGIEAYSELKNDLKVIINPELNSYEPRRRFTLAHELGHVCIPWHNGDVKCDTDNNYKTINGKKYLDTQELEANVFASELLMPSEWMKNEIDNTPDRSFFSLVEKIARDANTSIMACLYALEDKLDSGHIYFVRNINNGYYMTFKSINTFTVNWNYYEEDNICFLKNVCESEEIKTFGIHEVTYFELLPCPLKDDVVWLFNNCGNNIESFLNIITENCPIKALTFLDTIVEYLPENYAFFILHEDSIVKRVCDNSSTLCTLYPYFGLNNLLATCKYYSIDTCVMDVGYNYKIVSIKERVFQIPKCQKVDPNLLLKRIVNDIYWDDERDHMLKSINGLIASINSQYKNASREELYNWAKYKYYLNPKYDDFCMHSDFETYIVNKIDKMISMRT